MRASERVLSFIGVGEETINNFSDTMTNMGFHIIHDPANPTTDYMPLGEGQLE